MLAQEKGNFHAPGENRTRDSLLAFYLRVKAQGLVRNQQGEGWWKQREGHNFLTLRKGRGHEKWAIKRGRVMQIYARDHVELTFNLNHCDAAITFIKSLKLPPLCDHILQATDAGPGDGVTNIEVKYRDIEMPRINSWTHMNRIYRVPTRFRTKRSRAFQRCYM